VSPGLKCARARDGRGRRFSTYNVKLTPIHDLFDSIQILFRFLASLPYQPTVTQLFTRTKSGQTQQK